MLKAVDHLDQVKRVKISEKDLAPLQSHYQVSISIPLSTRFDTYTHSPKTALDQLKEVLSPSGRTHPR